MELSLTADVRQDLGKEKVSKLRREGKIPGVLYGEGKPVEHIWVNSQEFNRIILRHGLGKLITLDFQKGKKGSKEHVLIKECQRHQMNGNVLHVDFYRVAMDHMVTLKVPVHLQGEEKRPRDGAILELMIHELEISCLPANIPDSITVDVSNLPIGTGIHVKDLKVPEGIKVLNPLEEVIVIASSPNVTTEAVAPGEEVAEPEVIGEKKAEG